MNVPDVHDLVDKHQCMETCVEWTHVDNLVQSIGVTQHCLSVSYQTYMHIHRHTEIHLQFSIKTTAATVTATKVIQAQLRSEMSPFLIVFLTTNVQQPRW